MNSGGQHRGDEADYTEEVSKDRDRGVTITNNFTHSKHFVSVANKTKGEPPWV